MRGKVVILLVAWMLVTMVAGCGGAHRYDGRLVQADSLMPHDPDSALSLVQGISPDSLPTPGDRAYRDLLLTQGRYKCYITATTDSDINRALAYYSHHSGEREKLTRAYIYKGAVMEELGYPDSAMTYYKKAETTADPSDYANLGQINTRIGDLYREHYIDPQICFDKYSQALHYYLLTGNKRLQFDCFFHMGGCSGITRIGNPENLLKHSIQLANELNDSSKIFISKELLCRQLAYYGDSMAMAKQIALHCLDDYPDFINNDLLLDLAEIYAKVGKLDSARYYLDFVDEDAADGSLEQIRTRRFEILSEMALFDGDSIMSSYYDMLSHQLSDSILNSKLKYKIKQIERSFDRQHQNEVNAKMGILHWIILIMAVLTVIVIALLIIEHLRRAHNTKAIIKELDNINLIHANELLGQIDAHDTAIEHLIVNLISILKTCVNPSSKQISSAQLARQIKESIVDVADEGFWNELRSHLDHKHNNVISIIAQNPDISKKDLKFIELSCCGFSYLEIAMILGYSPRYVLNKRKIIAQKMGIQAPLQDHLNGLMEIGQDNRDYRNQ